MASWATFLFHSSVMAGGLTHVIRWMICQDKDSENIKGWETEISRKNQYLPSPGYPLLRQEPYEGRDSSPIPSTSKSGLSPNESIKEHEA